MQNFGLNYVERIAQDVRIRKRYTVGKSGSLRESTFIMSMGGGDEDVRGGAQKYFLALKGGALKFLDK
jgi:hypothetical protein